MFIATR